MQFFAESPLAGLQISLTDVSLTAPALVSTQPNKLPLPAANITDVYSPCTLPQNSGNDAIYVVNLPAGQSDTLNAALCSPGGYYQVCLLSCPAVQLPLYSCPQPCPAACTCVVLPAATARQLQLAACDLGGSCMSLDLSICWRVSLPPTSAQLN